MKKTKTLLFSGIAGLMVFAACKKNDDKTTADKVIGKWGVVSIVDLDVYNGQTYPGNYTGQSSDYVDFKSNGKVYSYVNGQADSVEYSVLSDKYILLDGDSSEIKTLTDNSFIIYSKDTYTGGYYESTISLKK